MSDLLPCPFCCSAEDPDIQTGLVRNTWIVVCGGCGGSSDYEESEASAIAAWNRRAPAPADPALLALGAIHLSRYRSVLPMPPHDQAGADAERALARFGAYVVRDWFRRTSGFQAADGHQLDAGALETGVVTHGATVGFRCSPGIADAIARLLAPDGAGEVAP